MRKIGKTLVFLILILVIPIISFYLIKNNQDTRSKASNETFSPTYLSSPKVVNLQRSFSRLFRITEGSKYVKKVKDGTKTAVNSSIVILAKNEELLLEKPANEPDKSRVIMEINLPEDYYSFSLELYDDASPNGGFQAGVYNNNNRYGYVIGFRDNVTQGNYMFQTFVSGGKQLNSGIPRQEGWHKLNFLATPEGTVGFFDGVGLRYLPQTEYDPDPNSKFQSGINTKIGRAKKLLIACAWSNLACNVKIRNVQINALNPPPANLVDRSQILIKQYYSYLTSQLKILSGESTLSLNALSNLNLQNSHTIRLVSELIPVQAYLYKTEIDPKAKTTYLNDSLLFLEWMANTILPNNKTPLNSNTKQYERIATGIGAYIIDKAGKLPENLKQIIKTELINESRNIYPQPVGNEFLKRSKSSENATRGTLLAITSNWFTDQPGNESINWNKKSRCLIYHSLSVSDDPADSYGEIPGCGIKTKNLFDGDYRDADTLSGYPDIFKNSTIPQTVPQKYWMSTHSALPAIHYMYGGSIVEISKAGMIALRLNPGKTLNDIPAEYKHNIFETYNSVRNMVQLETDSYKGTNIGLIKSDSVLVDPRDSEWSNENTFLKYGHDDRGTGVYLDAPAYIYPFIANSSFDTTEFDNITKKMWYLAPDFIAFPMNQGLPVYSPNQSWMSSTISRAMINAVALDRLTIATMLVDSNFSILD